MKKLITTLLIFSGIYSVAFAQNRNTAEFGISTGINASTILDSQTGEHTSYGTGVNFGVSLEYNFSDAWSIKAKAMYDQKGWGNGFVTTSDGTEIDGVTYHLNYITVPVMASWHFGQRSNWYINFGLYAGFLSNASESSNSADVNSAFNSTDVGLAYAVGVKLPVANKVKFFVEYEGQVGFTNVFTQSDGTYQNDRDSFNIGLSFALK
jgi:opacity protein-like surface antigen